MIRLIVMILLLQTAIGSAASLDVEGAISEARAKNPQLARAKAAAGEASWKPLEALSGHLPKVSLTASHAFDVQYQLIDLPPTFGAGAIPAVYPKTIFTGAVSLTVFDGLTTIRAYQAAKLSSKAADLEADRADFELERQVKVHYYQALAAQLLSIVADQNVKTLEDHLQRVKSLVSHGDATKFDSLRVQVQLEEAIPERLTVQDNAFIARKTLAALMGREDDDRTLSGELPLPNDKAVSAELKWDAASRGDLQALRSRAEAADDARSAAMGTWFPHVTLVASKDYYINETYSLGDPYREAYFVGVRLAWNLFDGASFAKRKAAAYARDQADASAAMAALKAPVDFETWKRRFLTSAQLYHARQRAIEAAEESVRLANVSVRAGTRTHTDLLDAELDLFRARAGLVKAQLDNAEALLNLELALGRRL